MHKILKEANADFKDVLKVDLYFYVVGINEPQTVSTFLQRLR